MMGLSRAIPATATHICVDMQNMFDEGTPWATGWVRAVLPQVIKLCAARPANTIFTRFLTPASPAEATGAWRLYYERHAEMTRNTLPPRKFDVVPELRAFSPPAQIIDKVRYSPWWGGELIEAVNKRGSDTVIVSGGETDVCVLATVLGAVDIGLRVVVARDALCSSSNRTHDAIVQFYGERLSLQIEIASVDEIIARWQR